MAALLQDHRIMSLLAQELVLLLLGYSMTQSLVLGLWTLWLNGNLGALTVWMTLT
jgi:hypothetical protein